MQKQNEQHHIDKTAQEIAIEKCKREWKVPSYYHIKSLLGHGSYGYVVEAMDTRTNTICAIKKISHLFSNLWDSKRVLREITLLRKFKSKRIIKIYDIIVDYQKNNEYNTIYVIMEHYPSDLKKLINSPVYLTNYHISLLSYNLLLAMKYLQQVGVLHRDIKPGNILINEDCDIKLCDFGLSRVVQQYEEVQDEDDNNNNNSNKDNNLINNLLNENENENEKEQLSPKQENMYNDLDFDNDSNELEKQEIMLTLDNRKSEQEQFNPSHEEIKLSLLGNKARLMSCCGFQNRK